MDLSKASEGTVHIIVSNLHKIKDRTFEKRDIRDLLFSIRGLLTNETYLFEISHVIAHTDQKDEGISHQFIDYVYTVYKLRAKEVTSGIKFDIRIFEAPIFKALRFGLNLHQEPMFKERTGIGLPSAIEFVNRYYRKVKDDSFFQLKDITRFDSAKKIFDLVLSGEMPFRLPLQENGFLNELNEFVNSFIIYFKFENVFLKDLVLQNWEEILLCLMTIYHDVRFKLFDGEFGSTFLSSMDSETSQQNLTGRRNRLSVYARIPMDTFKDGFKFPVLRSGIIASKFIEIPDIVGVHLENIPFDVRRNQNGNLFLTR